MEIYNNIQNIHKCNDSVLIVKDDITAIGNLQMLLHLKLERFIMVQRHEYSIWLLFLNIFILNMRHVGITLFLDLSWALLKGMCLPLILVLTIQHYFRVGFRWGLLILSTILGFFWPWEHAFNLFILEIWVVRRSLRLRLLHSI